MDEQLIGSAVNAQTANTYDNYLKGYFGSPFSQIASQFNEIYNELSGIRDYNNAWSASQAALQRSWSANEAEKNRVFNMVEAAKNRSWQEYMSNTAHVRETKDLIAAGLNPVLSAMGGNGAAVGSGATAAGVGNPSGADANTDESLGMAMASILGTILSNQQRMNETLLNANLTREQNDLARSLSKYLGELSSYTTLNAAKTSAGATMFAAEQALLGTKYTSNNNLVNAMGQRVWQARENEKDREFQANQAELTRNWEEYIRKNYPQTEASTAKWMAEKLTEFFGEVGVTSASAWNDFINAIDKSELGAIINETAAMFGY